MKALRLLPALLLAGGCMVGPDYQRPALDLPGRFADQPEAAPDASAATPVAIRTDWWTLFGDEELNRLIAGALAHGADMRIAVARFEQAEAALRETSAALLPELDLNEKSSRTLSSTATATRLPPGTPVLSNDHRLVVSTAFELDFWGRLRRASESARAQALASRYGRDVVALTVAAGTAQLYFAVRSLEAQTQAAHDTLDARTESLAIVRKRAAAGLASDLDLNQAETARSDAAIQSRALERQLAVLKHQLAALVGQLDLQLKPADFHAQPLPPTPPAGLPANLLERRPDVRQAEQLLISANADIGVARAAQFPTFSLTGYYGGESKLLNDAYQRQARIWSAGLGFTLPVIDAGKFAARTAQAEALQRQAAANYQKAVETAFREVADALTNLRQASQDQDDQQLRLTAAQNSLQLARERYAAGYSPYLEVLDAQRTAADAQLSALSSRQQLLGYSVDLIKALGGGWADNPAQVAR